jgi:hypothetical protein
VVKIKRLEYEEASRQRGERLTGRKRKGRSYFGILRWWERIRALKARRPWRRASLIRGGVRFVSLVVRTVLQVQQSFVPNGREKEKSRRYRFQLPAPASLSASHPNLHSHMYLTLAQSDFSTCEVSDALIKLGVPHAGHIADIHYISPYSGSESGGPAQGVPVVRLCGPAYTVRMVLASDHGAPKLQQSHFVDLAPEGSIAFVSAPSGWSPPLFLRSSSYTTRNPSAAPLRATSSSGLILWI